LVDAGFEVLAPCPHSAACPMEGTADWCHFAARVQRSALHRRVKGGELGHEDEKFSYVAAVRPGGTAAAPAPARVVRHPQLRKGLVLLELCTAGEGLARTTVSKRQGPRYRAARDVRWGDAWPPPEDGGHTRS
ncbi:small ribosomal subunit Rsm22 family protein, partial [Streptomyces phytophilus]|uniref:small ribosomal subunit Rsm22 family protein n=1 Tax=Streptomyces phytophilus TaxID=722715 RepID=UPI001C68C664